MSTSKKTSKNFDKLVPVLLVASIILAFAVGALWQKVSFMEKGTTVKKAENVAENDPQGPPPEGPSAGKLDEDQIANIPLVAMYTEDGAGDDLDSLGEKTGDHIMGSSGAKVFIVEYSDYECPFCSRFHPTAQQAVDDYGGEVAWVYRHFPLEFIHSKAKPAAVAAECVADLGGNEAFWKYTELLFADTPASLEKLDTLAGEVGVNVSDFNDCVESGKFDDLVQEQMDGGSDAGVTGTPASFVVSENGVWLVPGAVPFENMKQTIDEALQG